MLAYTRPSIKNALVKLFYVNFTILPHLDKLFTTIRIVVADFFSQVNQS